jgi:hypothetical protein
MIADWLWPAGAIKAFTSRQLRAKLHLESSHTKTPAAIQAKTLLLPVRGAGCAARIVSSAPHLRSRSGSQPIVCQKPSCNFAQGYAGKNFLPLTLFLLPSFYTAHELCARLLTRSYFNRRRGLSICAFAILMLMLETVFVVFCCRSKQEQRTRLVFVTLTPPTELKQRL